MNKLKKSQILMLSLLAILLTIAPLLSSSSRPAYIYFITNFLIIALGAEAGLLSFFSKPSDDKKNTCIAHHDHEKPAMTHDSVPDNKCSTAYSKPNCCGVEQKVVPHECGELTKGDHKVAEKYSMSKRVRKCPSTPSLFFIGGGEMDCYREKEEDNEEVVVGEISGQELFAKAETFIGNFYKQLKMQREDSWKRIHGFYHKAF